MCACSAVLFYSTYQRFNQSKFQSMSCQHFLKSIFSSVRLIPKKYLILQIYLNKLVVCLCSNYRSLELYEESMKTALSWSLIVPSNSNVFMEQYCLAKYKLSAKYKPSAKDGISPSNPKSPYVVSLSVIHLSTCSEPSVE